MSKFENIVITTNEYRPCYVTIGEKEHKALFHKWCERKNLLNSDYTAGLVELEDGEIREVLDTNIKFNDNKILEYYWPRHKKTNLRNRKMNTYERNKRDNNHE